MVAINRISSDSQRINESYSSQEEAANLITARKESENKRYMELYGADSSDLSHFDLVIDTSYMTPEQVAESIITGYDMICG